MLEPCDTVETIGLFYGEGVRRRVEVLLKTEPHVTVKVAFRRVQTEQQERARRHTESVLDAVMECDLDPTAWD